MGTSSKNNLNFSKWPGTIIYVYSGMPVVTINVTLQF